MEFKKDYDVLWCQGCAAMRHILLCLWGGCVTAADPYAAFQVEPTKHQLIMKWMWCRASQARCGVTCGVHIMALSNTRHNNIYWHFLIPCQLIASVTILTILAPLSPSFAGIPVYVLKAALLFNMYCHASNHRAICILTVSSCRVKCQCSTVFCGVLFRVCIVMRPHVLR